MEQMQQVQLQAEQQEEPQETGNSAIEPLQAANEDEVLEDPDEDQVNQNEDHDVGSDTPDVSSDMSLESRGSEGELDSLIS